ncbi:MAG: Hsp20 family protein [Pelagibacteraceae bacterium]|jgi:molecular chaperone IbpA|nr:Hsp20 family protein [Pelagibacteraceae bacterium]MDP6783899.1 Hsp20 family protein [Alphaproteobacteria bacterium]MBO6467877.1 Hsp20 family protein [Pelagibacteraceae bacterium]MBO6469893.1 Hsp20 family protein [Pelagibacteraceae bacterium]MBO6479867.1 Hsp20 family protein [Pelagibacteraceae bacterium]|tara:strand:- start:396 stop:833 length:438 start_codon:yes stop_codon:yes gene_type:complete
MTKNLSVWNSLKPFSVGFDSIFEEFDRVLDSTERYNSNYPPYNICKLNDNDYKIEVALAGYSKDDIEIELKDNTLTVRNKINEKVVNDESNGVIHKGISTRQFERSFTISEDIKVKNADLKNGLLNIDLERIVPEEKKPRLIDIN